VTPRANPRITTRTNPRAPRDTAPTRPRVLPPVLFALPCGSSLGGVTDWTRAAARALRDRGHPVAIILHAPRRCDSPAHISWPTGVRIIDLTNEPPLEPPVETPLDSPPLDSSSTASLPDAAILERIATRYAHAVRDLYDASTDRPRPPVVAIPTLLGECAGLFVRAAQILAEPPSSTPPAHHPLRIAAVVHSPVPYDRVWATHYALPSPRGERALAALAAVSPALALATSDLLNHRLARAPLNSSAFATPLPQPSLPVDTIEVGVATRPNAPLPREPGAGVTRSLRLAYVGRLDADVKGVLALPHMLAMLASLGIRTRLAIAGDGPARDLLHDRLIAAAADPSRVRLLGTRSTRQVRALLRWADAVVLPSRVEGLSMTLLEALAQGCIPIGSAGALGQPATAPPPTTALAPHTEPPVRDGIEALVVPEPQGLTSDERDAVMGTSLAAAAAALVRIDASATPAHAASGRHDPLDTIRLACVRRARERFSPRRFARTLSAFVSRAATAPPPAWPTDRPCHFTHFSPTHGSGVTPHDAPQRLRAALESIAREPNRRVAILGTGRHTLDLAPIIRDAAARGLIIALADDAPHRHNTRLLGLPVLDPRSLHSSLGVTDLIISSWLHERDIARRTDAFARHGVRLHTLYNDGAVPSMLEPAATPFETPRESPHEPPRAIPAA
jgi:glycosyltransferase involved in cell wall biosynthesis